MKTIAFALFVLLFAASFLPLAGPVNAQGPIGGALATLAAATAEAQQTRAVQESEYARQRATATALAIEQIRAQATRRAEEHAANAEATAIALDAMRAEQTRVAEDHATRRAENATATAQARASATVQARATATARVEQTATAQAAAYASQTAQARATATAQAYADKEFESKLQRERLDLAARAFFVFVTGATLLALIAVWGYRELIKKPRRAIGAPGASVPSQPVQVLVTPDRIASDPQFRDLDIPTPFTSKPEPSPIMVVTHLPDTVIAEVTRAFQNANESPSDANADGA